MTLTPLLVPTPEGVALTSLDPAPLVESGLHRVLLAGANRAVDHAAIVVSNLSELEQFADRAVAVGASLVEPPHRFPSGVCAEAGVAADLEKHMVTLGLSSGLLVVAAPMRPGDQAHRHLERWGPFVPHHVAVSVTDIRRASGEWASGGYRIGPVVDDGSLAQAFIASPTGQIVELITRATPSVTATFSCQNVATLSDIERRLTPSPPT